MNILGFNPSHHGSVCLLQDGELKYFIQEERIGRREKYTAYPFKGFIDILQKYKIDHITWGTPSMRYPISSKILFFPYWQQIAFTYSPNVKFTDISSNHHLCHISHSFYNSGFKKCIGVVIDGLGSNFFNTKKQDIGQETESIYTCSYPHSFKTLFKNFCNDKAVNLSQAYETITMHLGWTKNEAGKTMGLAPYGNYNPNFPQFFNKLTTDSNVFFFNKDKNSSYNKDHTETFIDEEKNPQLKLQRDPKEWHHDESRITNLEKDLAWQIQNDTQQIVGNYIETAIKETGLKQVCCAGGYFLNCVTNYYLVKRFPDVEFYFEPIANDAGTAIGAAKAAWYLATQDTITYPFKSLYLGKQYSKDELLEGIKKYI